MQEQELLQVPYDAYGDPDVITRLNTAIESLTSKEEIKSTEDHKESDLIKLKEALINSYNKAKDEKDNATEKAITGFIENLEKLDEAFDSPPDKRLSDISDAFALMISTAQQDSTCGSACFKYTMRTICGITGTLTAMALGACGGALITGIAMSYACLMVGCCCTCCGLCGNGNCCSYLTFCFTKNLPIALCLMTAGGIIGSLGLCPFGAVVGYFKGDEISEDYRTSRPTYRKLADVRETLNTFYSRCSAVLFPQTSANEQLGEEKIKIDDSKSLRMGN